jgi:hypothetical protein
MADPIVISSLSKKRAEIDGTIRASEKRIAQLRIDLGVIDAAIRIFDPSRLPSKIKPIQKRAKPTLFRHGECARAVLDVLRTAEEPLTVRAIAERMASEYHLDLKEPDELGKLINRVRNALLRRKGNNLVREQGEQGVTWRVAES